MNHKWFPLFCAGFFVFILAWEVCAKGPMVSAMGNRHNLSAQNTAAGITYRAIDDAVNNPGGQQICIFCHTPHNSQPQGPLWNRRDTTQIFARYTSNTLQIKNLAASQYSVTGDSLGQPNGSSRLCLSCHDGVTGLGDVLRSGQMGQIQMLSGNNNITGVASFHPSTNKMKVGHHPVSFVFATSFDYKTQLGTMIGLNPGVFKLPAQVPNPEMAAKVKLQDSKRDSRGWMQCTTCHDPHQNMGNDSVTYPPAFTRKITPFWVYSGASAVTGHDAVCTSCHLNLLAPYNVGGSNPPWPYP